MNSDLRVFGALLWNDLRLAWRSSAGARLVSLAPTVFLGGLCVLGHVIALLLARIGRVSLEGEAAIWALCAFAMFLSGVLTSITRVFAVADSALLLSSPASPAAIMLARLCSVAVACFLAPALFVMPLIDAAAIRISPHYLWGYAVWLLLAVAIAALAMIWTLILVALVGPRRARTFSQVCAIVLGAGASTISQLVSSHAAQRRWLFHGVREVVRLLGFKDLARGGHGQPGAIGELALFAGLTGLISAGLFGRTFFAGLQINGEGAPGRSAARHRAMRWRGRLGTAAFFKDVRLIVRDPLLLAQLLPQVIYFIPALIALLRVTDINIASAGMLAVVFAARCAPMLTHVSVDGEEGWELIRLSPTPEIRLRWSKVAAGVVVPLGLCILLCLAVAFRGRPGIALLSASVAALCGTSCSWLVASRCQPVARKDIAKQVGRRQRGGMTSMAIGILGAAGIGLVASGGMWWVLVGWILLAALALAAATILVVVEPRPAA